MLIELFKDGVKRDWRAVLRAAGYDDKDYSRQDLWDLLNPTELICHCGAERPVRLTATGRLQTCGHEVCKNTLKSLRTVQTSQARYGVDRPMQCPVVQARQHAAFEAKFSGHPTKNVEVQQKRLVTNLARYGTATPAVEASRLTASISKRKETALENYRLNIWPARKQYFLEHLGIKVLSEFISAKDELICQHLKCGTEWTAVPKPAPCCPVCSTSREQQGVQEFIQSLGVSFNRNIRSIIPPYELDIFIPAAKVAIELNGMYWHRENIGTPIALKTKLTAELDIRLLHISDNNWNEHADIIKSHIKHALRLTDIKIAARKCTVSLISSAQSSAFLQRTHLAGSANASHCIGLFFESKLVAVMTLGKPRWGDKTGLEIIRWSTELNSSIQGGFTKVLSFVQAELSPVRIISYCDLRTGFGGVYKAAGFEFNGTTKPGYIWVRGKVVLSRQQTQKHRLNVLLGDKFNPLLSEAGNMEACGWSRVFDAGHQRWILT